MPQLPYNLDAEVATLGSAFIRPTLLSEYEGLIPSSEAFYRPAHQKIYLAMQEVYQTGGEIDYITVANKLLEKGDLEGVGGADTLMRLAEAAPYGQGGALDHAKIVVECYRKRLLYEHFTNLAQSSLNGKAADSIIEEAEEGIFNISAVADQSKLIKARDVYVGRAEDWLGEGKSSHVFIPTGLTAIDQTIIGLERETVTILAGLTSHGKTALALFIARNVAARGEGTAVFSFEMGEEAIVDRLAANIAEISLSDLRKSSIIPGERSKLNKGCADLGLDMHICTDTEMTPERLISLCKRFKAERIRNLKKEHKDLTEAQIERQALSLVVIDYLQLMAPPKNLRRNANRENEVAAISRAIKKASGVLKCSFLVLSQFRRAVEPGEKPELYHLRESGAIEQDADKVIFIWRPDPEDKRKLKVEIAKNRQGPTDSTGIDFGPEFGRFR